MTESNSIKATDGVVLIMTCDKYSQYWSSLYHYMKQLWDYDIPWQICLCTEDYRPIINDPKWSCLNVGKGSFHERQKKALEHFKDYKYIFFMLEDFWPTRPMTYEMFSGLFSKMVEHDWDCLHIDTMRPELYKVETSDVSFAGKKFLKMCNDGEWLYNQQAAFWKRDLLYDCTIAGEIPEEAVMTTLSFEQCCDRYMRKNFPQAKVMLYHYWWYPRSGVVWRGELSLIGKEMDVHMHIDNYCNNILEINKI